MRRAVCLIRPELVYRREAFLSGLRAVGYKIVEDQPTFVPTANDIVVMWNRHLRNELLAKRCEHVGAKLVICENGYLGKDWLGDTWFAMSLGHHSGAGTWLVGGAERWDALDVPMQPFRSTGEELLILGQRGLGEAGVAAPRDWAQHAHFKYGGRFRQHPGNDKPKRSIEDDLDNVWSVATWHSGAALKALICGVPVWHDFPKWIGAEAAAPLACIHQPLATNRNTAKRLAMFRRLIWAQWRLDEIACGKAFDWLLQKPAESAAMGTTFTPTSFPAVAAGIGP